jgi:N-methylhydantoinase B
MSDTYQSIRNQVMWDRLINVVEEQARTMMRVAFSPVVREAGDLSAGVFNPAGQLLAQAVTGTPGHINSMARSVRHFMNVIPPAQMKPGDSYITNDPWKGTGHLFDLTVVTPAFVDGKLAAMFACTAHVADIGGNGPDPHSRDVLAEGLFIPIMPLCNQGEMNSWLINLMRANSREPDRLEGDVYALVASNEAGASRLIRMMAEYQIDNLDALSTYILETSDRAMGEAIAKLPKGTWTNVMRIDGFKEPIDLATTLTIDGETIAIDFAGTSPVSKYGINCPLCYTDAYTSFGVKCLVAPHLVNNAAILARIKITAPDNCIVNAPYPAPVTARAVLGQMLPDAAFGCFAKAMPETTPAEGTGASWSLRLGAGRGLTGQGDAGQGVAGTGGDGKPPARAYMSQNFQSGGMGGHPLHDGMSATAFPSGVRTIAMEITEAMTPLVFWRRELRTNSGGAGKYRGGLGQIVEVGNRADEPFVIFAQFQRVAYPAAGRNHGHDGAAGEVALQSGASLEPNGVHVIAPGERLVTHMPGGGGFGSPLERDPAAVLQDVIDGFVTRDAARELYGTIITADHQIDKTATQALRSGS